MDTNFDQEIESAGPDGPAEPGQSGATPSRLLLDQITDKWSILILAALCQKPLRFNELRRAVGDITQKALTHSLRRLERSGILARRVIPSSQVAVEYSVTPLGRTLEEPFRVLYAWTTSHAADVLQAQSAFDLRDTET